MPRKHTIRVANLELDSSHCHATTIFSSLVLTVFIIKPEGRIDDERQFKTAKRSQAPGDSTEHIRGAVRLCAI